MKLEQFQSAVTDVREEYVEDLYDYIDGKKANLHAKRRTGILLAAAVLSLIALSLSLFFALRKSDPPPVEPTPTATVYIDADRSIAINVDNNKTVLSVKVNGDAKDLLIGTDYTGKHIDTAVREMVALSVEKGVLNASQNDILLSVESNDPMLAKELSEELKNIPDAVIGLIPDGMAAVPTVATEQGKRLIEIADTYNVSLGQAKYILGILEANDRYAPEDLSRFSRERLRELYDLIASKDRPEPVTVERAIEIILADAGANASEITVIDCTYTDYQEMGDFEYSFTHGDIRYKYILDPVTGEILFKKTALVKLSEDDALNAALTYRGVEKAELIYSKTEYSEKYNVYFVVLQLSGKDYRLTVSAETGVVVSSIEKEFKLANGRVYEIIQKDLGLPEDEPDFCSRSYKPTFGNGECSTYSVETSVGIYNYLIDRIGGKILYKEKTSEFNSFSKDFAIAAACAYEKSKGATNISIIECGTSQIAGDYNVVLSVDGNEMIVIVSRGKIE